MKGIARMHHGAGMMKEYSTDHYVFHYGDGTKAAEDITEIAAHQEKCFRYICSVLNTEPNFKIQYYLCDSPEEVGRMFGDNEACNGLADTPDKVYATYNDKIQCIGFHEDAHIIASTMNSPPCSAIKEGLSMYFDRTWWGIHNLHWAVYYFKTKQLLPIDKLLNQDSFFEVDCSITYPIVGSFTEWLISSYGLQKYLKLFRENDIPNAIERIYGMTASAMSDHFTDYLSLFANDSELEKRMRDLRENR